MKKEHRGGGKIRLVVMNGMRLILLLALIVGLVRGRYLILIISIVGLIATFLPAVLKKVFKVDVPAGFEIVALLFVYGLLYVGEVKGVYEQFWIFGVLLKLLASVILGFIGLAALYALYKQEKIQGPPLVIAFFAFCFAVAVGALWELFEFSLDNLFGFTLQKAGLDTMKDLASYVVGAGIVSIAGYRYLKRGRIIVISNLVEKVVARNASRLGIAANPEHVKEHVKKLISDGENHHVEFKSTLRTNLYTGQIDKSVEHAALKTVAGYLNSDGGTLLVGVDDKKEIGGLEKDNFPSQDKLSLHLTNLIKEHIGAEYLPFIDMDIVDVDGKNVLKVECKKSPKKVFLKMGKDEHFYVRNGPSTATLTGSSLVDYIAQRFGL